MCILNDSDFHNCIFWSDEGDAFCVHPNLFTERVLGPYFQGSKYHSFTRKCNRWSFKRIIGDSRFPPDAFAFQHKLFVRDKPELSAGMKEGSRSRSSTETSASKKRGILKNVQDPLTRVIPGASFESTTANGLGLGASPASVHSPPSQMPQQHSAARPLSAFEMLQHHQLQSLLQTQQHSTQHAAFPTLSGSNLQALLRQNNLNADYRHSLAQTNNNHDRRPMVLPTDADILRLLSLNHSEGSSSSAAPNSHDSFFNYLQQQFNNGRG